MACIFGAIEQTVAPLQRDAMDNFIDMVGALGATGEFRAAGIGGAVATPRQHQIAGRVLQEISERLDFLLDVGLGYLTLDRQARTLSPQFLYRSQQQRSPSRGAIGDWP